MSNRLSQMEIENHIFCAFLIGSKLQYAADKSTQPNLDVDKCQNVFMQLCEKTRQGNYSIIDYESDNQSLEQKIEKFCSNMMLKNMLAMNNLEKGIYFSYDEEEKVYYIVTEEFWKKNRCLDDQHIMDSIVLPEGFIEVSESHFEYDGTPEQGKAGLKEFGLIENVKILP